MNHDLKRLEQKHDEDDEYVIKVSSDFKVKDDENETPIYYKMIDHIDDIIKILKLKQAVDSAEKETIYLIHRNDDLPNLLLDLIDKCYTPGIKYETGRIINLILSLNKTILIIRTQQLVTSTIERPIIVDSELVYNNMSDAMTKFNKQMFKLGYKSYYNKQDIDILDEYRTFSNTGMLSKRPKERLNELDVSKAYTASLTQTDKIAVYYEFDNFQPYEGQEIQDYGFYIVKAKKLDLYYNKTYNLCYGMFLKDPQDVKDVEIKAFKLPSAMKTPNYKNYC